MTLVHSAFYLGGKGEKEIGERLRRNGERKSKIQN